MNKKIAMPSDIKPVKRGEIYDADLPEDED